MIYVTRRARRQSGPSAKVHVAYSLFQPLHALPELLYCIGHAVVMWSECCDNVACDEKRSQKVGAADFYWRILTIRAPDGAKKRRIKCMTHKRARVVGEVEVGDDFQVLECKK